MNEQKRFKKAIVALAAVVSLLSPMAARAQSGRGFASEGRTLMLQIEKMTAEEAANEAYQRARIAAESRDAKTLRAMIANHVHSLTLAINNELSDLDRDIEGLASETKIVLERIKVAKGVHDEMHTKLREKHKSKAYTYTLPTYVEVIWNVTMDHIRKTRADLDAADASLARLGFMVAQLKKLGASGRPMDQLKALLQEINADIQQVRDALRKSSLAAQDMLNPS